MIKNIIKTLSLILFIYLPSNAIGQTTGISKDEKKQLEERFKNLKTFYIDDDGLVVYTGVAPGDSIQAKRNLKSEATRVKVKVSVNDVGGYVVSQEEENFSLAEHDTVLTIPENRYIRDDFAAKPDSVETEQVIFVNKDADLDFTSADESLDSKSENQSETAVAGSTKRNVSLKRRTPTKSADATLAELEELIGELRAQQNRQNRKNVNSLSNKISGGVDAKIRQDYSHDLSDLSEDGDSVGAEEEITKDTPVYYINGVKSTKEEFVKLKPDEIRRKEIRRSKENPSGEWWVQTR